MPAPFSHPQALVLPPLSVMCGELAGLLLSVQKIATSAWRPLSIYVVGGLSYERLVGVAIAKGFGGKVLVVFDQLLARRAGDAPSRSLALEAARSSYLTLIELYFQRPAISLAPYSHY